MQPRFEFRKEHWAITLALAFAVVAGLLYYPVYERQVVARQLGGVTNNMRLLHLALLQMETDWTVSGNLEVGWPGDLGRGSNPVLTVSDLLRRMVEHDYLTRSDVQMQTSARGYPGWNPDDPNADRDCAIKVYRVTHKDSPRAILFATRNFTYGKPLDPAQMPHGDQTAAILHKAGDGIWIKRSDALKPARSGLLPGRKDEKDRPLETKEDTLEQR